MAEGYGPAACVGKDRAGGWRLALVPDEGNDVGAVVLLTVMSEEDPETAVPFLQRCYDCSVGNATPTPPGRCYQNFSHGTAQD
jgi:hypothetical protein